MKHKRRIINAVAPIRICDLGGWTDTWFSETGNILNIYSQKEPPPDAFVRVFYRDHWFYIADNDLESKTTFGLVSYLFSLQAAGVEGKSPLLTVSAGR